MKERSSPRHGEVVGARSQISLCIVIETDVDLPVPLTTEEIAKRLLDSPVPLTMVEIADSPQTSRKSRRKKSWQNKKVLLDWDEASRLSALLRLVADLEALLNSGQLKGSGHEQCVRGSIAGCRRETEDMDDCVLHDQKDMVESILTDLQQCVVDPAKEWLAQQSL